MKRSNQILVELQEFMGSDKAVANAAWSSTYDKDKRDHKLDYDNPEKIKDLIENKLFGGLHVHGVPIESVQLRFWIRMPIFSDRQHMTHRIASHNGLSGRYRTMPLDYFDLPEDVEDIIVRVDNKLPNQFPTPQNPNTNWNMYNAYYDSCETATNNYKLSIDKLKKAEKDGIITNKEFRRVREVLRGQLPTAGMIERTTIMNLRSFANYQKLRNHEDAQPEIKQVAEMMLEALEADNICPITLNCLKKRNWET